MLTIKIAERNIGPGYPPYVIAELSANHNGSIHKAFETITAAKRSGADAVKLQTYTPDTMTIVSDAPDFTIKGGLWDGYTLYDLYKSAHTPYEWHKDLFEHGRNVGITVFSTPFDKTAVDLLEDLNAPAYKIASFEITDLELIRYAGSTGKPMIISTGMASVEEIAEAVEVARDAGCSGLVLLHCISSYPAPLDQANLRQIPELGRKFNVISGLSDHTMGTTAAVASVALGASVIEKHFILSRADKGPDSDFSLEPHELELLCTNARDAWISLGSPGFDRKPAEKANRVFRRSIYFVRDLPAGAEIGPSDIRCIRPGLGLPPKYFDDLVGRRLKAPVKRGEPSRWEIVE